MPIPKEIIDNSEGNQLVDFLNNILKENPKTSFDIATALFNIRAYKMVKYNLNGLKKFRMLLGKAPDIRNERTLRDELLRRIREEIEGFELSKEKESNILKVK